MSEFKAEYDEALREAVEAVTMLTCPIYRERPGKCQRHACFDDPECVTNEPREGWVDQLGRAVNVMEQLPEER